MSLAVSLSKLVAGRCNPRRVKPERDAHRRLVASIRAFGLLEPLVVRPWTHGLYQVVAGNRRLAALRSVHDDANTKIPCVLKAVDNETARAISLSENFVREPMHPLDEADAFAELASVDCMGVNAIASHFGVSPSYVRQRMKLSTLADPIKAAYRSGNIDTMTAEAFATVPPERQLELWNEVGGAPRHAQHVRNLIENQWIPATHALFDLTELPDNVVSSDLFNDRVLVERSAFMAAQSKALASQRDRLIEDGWKEVLVSDQSEVQDRLYSMETPAPVYDEETEAKLCDLVSRREALEATLDDTESEDTYSALDALDREEESITSGATAQYDESTKAAGTAFILLDPDGRVRTEYRVPRVPGERRGENSHGAALPPAAREPMPTSQDLSERQQAAVYTHEAIAVRHSLSRQPRIVRVLTAMMLHEKVRTDSLSVRRDANGTNVHAENVEGFTSPTFTALKSEFTSLDPIHDQHYVEECEAYEAFSSLPDDVLDRLIQSLAVDCLAGHAHRPTPLITQLRSELSVNIREHWCPDAHWLSSYQKCQLAHLVGELRGAVYGSAALRRKKSELVDELAKLFAGARAGTLSDTELAARVNSWVPSILTTDVEILDAREHAA